MKIKFTEDYKEFAKGVSKNENIELPFDLDMEQDVVKKLSNEDVLLKVKDELSRDIIISPRHYIIVED